MSPYWKIALITQLILSFVLGTIIPVVSSAIFLMGSVALTGQAAQDYREFMKAKFKRWLLQAIGSFLAVFAAADLAVFGAPYVWVGYLKLLNALGVQLAQTGIALVVVGIGYGAFQFKDHHKKPYGFVEVLFSFVSVVVALMTSKPDQRSALVITIIGAVYVSSRGFGNWLGKKKD